MIHSDHIALLTGRADDPSARSDVFQGLWADLGAGSGAFTLALADLIGERGQIFAVDKDRSALGENARHVADRFPQVRIEHVIADFTRDLDLPLLDGIVMANSVHFHKHKAPIVDRVHTMLKPGGRLILIEYNVDRGNLWVPHPLSFKTWQALASQHGFAETRLLHVYPSRFLNEIYSAESVSADRG